MLRTKFLKRQTENGKTAGEFFLGHDFSLELQAAVISFIKGPRLETNLACLRIYRRAIQIICIKTSAWCATRMTRELKTGVEDSF